jgi:hypothetical protein
MLSPGYEQYSDASGGPLKQGEVGTLVEDDGGGKPYRVEAPNGKMWWYQKEALVAAQVEFRSSKVSAMSSTLYSQHISCSISSLRAKKTTICP